MATHEPLRAGCLVSASVLWCALLWAPPAHAEDRRTTEATLNVYRGNPSAAIRADVRAAMARASVIRFQETYPPRAWRAVAGAVRSAPSWRFSRLPAGELALAYDARVWAPVRPPRARLVVVPPASGWPRSLVWQALRFRPTGAVVRVANVHADARTCTWPLLGRLVGAARYWDVVAQWTRAHPRNPILLGGDFNCSMRRGGAAWKPGNVLAPLYRRGPTGGVDHLLTSRTPGAPAVVRRWSVAVNSDHRLQLRRLLFARHRE